MNSRITLTHDIEDQFYSVELAIPTFGDEPLTHNRVFTYGGEDGQHPTAREALVAAETYAEAAGDMARLMGKGGLDHNAGGFLVRAREAREIDEAMSAGLAG